MHINLLLQEMLGQHASDIHLKAGAVQYRMQTFDQSLLDLYRRDLITMEDALSEPTTPTDLKLGLDGLISSGMD